MVIYLDPASIHNEILRRHPEINPSKSVASLDRSTSDTFAVISDLTDCEDGQEITIDHYDDEDYYGFLVQIARWRVKNPLDA